MEPVRVSVIIASWNAGAVLGACLERLREQEVAGGYETIVVDNGSTDDTPEVLRRHADGIRVIRNDHNAGFSAANNQAAEQARGEILFFLNSDTELLAPDTLGHVARTFSDPGVGIAGPRLVNPDGTLQPSCAAHPTVLRALLVMTGLHLLLPDSLLARVHPDRWSHSAARDVDAVKGAALAIRADVFRRVGGFWPTLYGEEQDLAYRVQQEGLRVRFDPRPQVMHVRNHSLGQRQTSTQRAERVAQAELLFLHTHYGPVRREAIRLVVAGGLAARALAHRLLRRRPVAEAYRAMTRVYWLGRAAPSSG